MRTNHNDMPFMSDRERVKNAFKELRRLGWFARMNYWCCQSCGCAAAASTLTEKGVDDDDRKVIFYHQQDQEHAFPDGSKHLHGDLYLTHSGPSYEAVGVLHKWGLHVVWDGNDNTRIKVCGKQHPRAHVMEMEKETKS